MKKKVATLLLSATLLLQIPVFANHTVTVNGEPISSDSVMINDRIYVPLRAVSESMGAQVSWDDSTQTASIEFDEDMQTHKMIEQASKSVVAIVGNYKPEYMSQQALSYNESYAHGTGVIIKNNGLILTNAHVVENIENITVIFGNGECYPATLQCMDKTSDLATVKINKLGLTPIKFAAKDDIKVGISVVAIGAPLSLSMINSASKGIISGKNVSLSGSAYYFTQSDVAINGGNSGGPLLNMKGELVGINSVKFAGIGIEGMSFSIPVDTVTYVLNQFETNKRVIMPTIPATVTESWEARLGVPTTKGLTVKTSSVSQLTSGDVIIAVNGVEVHTIADCNEALKNTYSGGNISLTFTRNATLFTIDVAPVLK